MEIASYEITKVDGYNHIRLVTFTTTDSDIHTLAFVVRQVSDYAGIEGDTTILLVREMDGKTQYRDYASGEMSATQVAITVSLVVTDLIGQIQFGNEFLISHLPQMKVASHKLPSITDWGIGQSIPDELWDGCQFSPN